MDNPIKVLCVDDSPDITEALRALLGIEPKLQFVGCLASADRLIEEAGRLHPDVVLMDATMPGRDPFEATAELAATQPEVRVLMYTGYDDAATSSRARSSGARGCLCKDLNPLKVLDAIKHVAEHGTLDPDGARPST